MKRLVTVLLIVLVMACICYVPAHADEFQRQQQASICISLAELTAATARARDAGISWTDQLAIVNASPDADVREDGLRVMHFVWHRPHTAPDWIGQAMLLQCTSAIK